MSEVSARLRHHSDSHSTRVRHVSETARAASSRYAALLRRRGSERALPFIRQPLERRTRNCSRPSRAADSGDATAASQSAESNRPSAAPGRKEHRTRRRSTSDRHARERFAAMTNRFESSSCRRRMHCSPSRVERSPQLLQRTVNVRPSSERPTTSVLWLPHLGQVGGGLSNDVSATGSVVNHNVTKSPRIEAKPASSRNDHMDEQLRPVFCRVSAWPIPCRRPGTRRLKKCKLRGRSGLPLGE